MNDSFGGVGRLADYGMELDKTIAQLMAHFPQVANLLAWREAIFSAQSRYQSDAPELADHQLYIATRWLEDAQDGCLEAKMDPVKGLIVREILKPQTAISEDVIRKQIKKILFNKLSALPDSRLLQIYEVMHAFELATGVSLKSYGSEFEEAVNELLEKSYIQHHQLPRRGMSRFCKGIDFDIWKAEMTRQPFDAAPMGHTYNTFNASVGVAQTGAYSVAHVQQSFDSGQLPALKKALEAILAEVTKADLPAETLEDAQGLIESAIAEVDKPKPNKLSLHSLLNGVATTVQTLGSSSGAYQLLKTALTPFGIVLP